MTAPSDPTALVAEWTAAMEGVTPGPWNPSRFGMQVLTGDSWATICTFHDKNGGDGKWNDHRLASWEDGRGAALETSNADWVARCSPAGIAPLLALIAQQAATIGAAKAGWRDAEAALTAAEAERDRLREALEPLAKVDCATGSGHAFDGWPVEQVVFGIGSDRNVTVGDLRRARAALSTAKERGDA